MSDVEIEYHETIFDVSESLLRKRIDYEIVPIENSLEGSVGDTLDILSREDENAAVRVQIVGEILVPIKICLLAKSNIATIKKLVSHPHALAQCKHYVRKTLKGVEIKTMDSTASAAKLASENNEIAALASEEAAKKYRLTVLEENVQDKESVTRFIVLALASAADTKTKFKPKFKPEDKDKYKTSLLIYLKEDRSGALYDVLGEFARRKINLTKIESRPSKKALGDYMFHVDCEGHLEDEEIKEALNGVEKKVAMLKILGSYPHA